MALLFIDGWDYYDTADLPLKWDSLIADFDSNTPDLSSGTGRYTGQAVHLGPYGFSGLTKSFATTQSFIVGFAIHYSVTANYGQILGFPGPSGLAKPYQVYLKLDNGTLSVVAGTWTGVSATQLTSGTWNYVEILVSGLEQTASSIAGSIQLKINGVVVVTCPANMATAGDTFSLQNTMSRVVLGGGTGDVDTKDVYIDDLYVCDTLGSTNNSFLGDCRIEVIRPSAAGTSTQWTPDSGSNYARVNEAFEDGDTSYIKSNTVTQVDTYAMADLSATYATIKAVQVCTFARKDDIGTRIISSAIKSGSTTYDHGTSNPFGLGDNYIQGTDVWELDPNGNIPWTTTSVNAMEVGVKLVD